MITTLNIDGLEVDVEEDDPDYINGTIVEVIRERRRAIGIDESPDFDPTVGDDE